MKHLITATLFALLPAFPSFAGPAKLVEPSLRVSVPDAQGSVVALTFDACTGKVDDRILSTLIDNQIPATIFVTARWLKHNQPAFQTMLAHPDLFEIENHGENHIPAVDVAMKVYNIDAAGSRDAVGTEISKGASAITAAGAPLPLWFRGATAKYTPSSIKLARDLGFKVAGYSLNGDVGASLLANQAEKRISNAKNGDVILAHINQPSHSAGDGVVKGILALKAKGMTFVRLQDGVTTGSDETTKPVAKAGF